MNLIERSKIGYPFTFAEFAEFFCVHVSTLPLLVGSVKGSSANDLGSPPEGEAGEALEEAHHENEQHGQGKPDREQEDLAEGGQGDLHLGGGVMNSPEPIFRHGGGPSLLDVEQDSHRLLVSLSEDHSIRGWCQSPEENRLPW